MEISVMYVLPSCAGAEQILQLHGFVGLEFSREIEKPSSGSPFPHPGAHCSALAAYDIPRCMEEVVSPFGKDQLKGSQTRTAESKKLARKVAPRPSVSPQSLKQRPDAPVVAWPARHGSQGYNNLNQVTGAPVRDQGSLHSRPTDSIPLVSLPRLVALDEPLASTTGLDGALPRKKVLIGENVHAWKKAGDAGAEPQWLRSEMICREPKPSSAGLTPSIFTSTQSPPPPPSLIASYSKEGIRSKRGLARKSFLLDPSRMAAHSATKQRITPKKIFTTLEESMAVQVQAAWRGREVRTWVHAASIVRRMKRDAISGLGKEGGGGVKSEKLLRSSQAIENPNMENEGAPVYSEGGSQDSFHRLPHPPVTRFTVKPAKSQGRTNKTTTPLRPKHSLEKSVTSVTGQDGKASMEPSSSVEKQSTSTFAPTKRLERKRTINALSNTEACGKPGAGTTKPVLPQHKRSLLDWKSDSKVSPCAISKVSELSVAHGPFIRECTLSSTPQRKISGGLSISNNLLSPPQCTEESEPDDLSYNPPEKTPHPGDVNNRSLFTHEGSKHNVIRSGNHSEAANKEPLKPMEQNDVYRPTIFSSGCGITLEKTVNQEKPHSALTPLRSIFSGEASVEAKPTDPGEIYAQHIKQRSYCEAPGYAPPTSEVQCGALTSATPNPQFTQGVRASARKRSKLLGIHANSAFYFSKRPLVRASQRAQNQGLPPLKAEETDEQNLKQQPGGSSEPLSKHVFDALRSANFILGQIKPGLTHKPAPQKARNEMSHAVMGYIRGRSVLGTADEDNANAEASGEISKNELHLSYGGNIIISPTWWRSLSATSTPIREEQVTMVSESASLDASERQALAAEANRWGRRLTTTNNHEPRVLGIGPAVNPYRRSRQVEQFTPPHPQRILRKRPSH
ncbi:hypothetical protein cyc_05793 [Cyclospora cayetanensis]|uniref:Uncharacterized protein n=1 Tax=Cyclospora cayetanensis TaxID=88456 RepID=A0A1D3CVL0_9EIME|nr:hypothetical protein cyc_05793 [Cyclospora cayetanensis]